MNRLLLLASFAIVILVHPSISAEELPASPSSIKLNKYVGYFGNFLKALSYAKKLHPSLAVPNLSEIKLGYNILRGSMSAYKATQGDGSDQIVHTPIEKISDLGLVTVKTGAAIVGYALPYTYAAYVLSGAAMTSGYLPTIYEFFSSTLEGPKDRYNLSEFEIEKRETTYLACSYTDPNNAKANFKTWADESLIGSNTELKSFLKFYKNTVLINGRWILMKEGSTKYYVFGTTMDPLLLESACIEAVASYAMKHNIALSDTGTVQMSSGNTSFANSYPIRFFYPVVMKAPTWSKLKPVILRKALLLTTEPD